ncbi:MAG: succinate dehydrogenase/fumarate reductase cytochrome b subunit [Bacteroidaceae bacterium]|nr:succinate dehydrogenase/fumarate reductase cytochrome b subunit [Bacteroidaceae bacterium]
MWLCNSSIGRKVVMSVTGMALILFLTFHGCMNVVALFSAKGYNMICEFLGANWYAVVATIGLAVLALIHIVYAFWLTIQNRKARGSNRYDVTEKPAKVEWASQNMLVLGIIILLGLLLHLFNFWYNMMFAELFQSIHFDPAPADGFGKIVNTFSNPIYVVLYIIWIIALWFHLAHGFWSAIQTIGWSGHIWFNRWRIIGIIYVTLLMLMFLAVIIGFATGLAPSLQDACCGGGACCGEEMCGGMPECAGH